MDAMTNTGAGKDARALEMLEAELKNMGRDELEDLLKLGASLPAHWRNWPPERCLEYLRCRLEFTQAELATKAALVQSLVSRIEGGAPALLTTWTKLFKAMGFDLVLLPVSALSIEELKKRAEEGRPQGHWLRQRARPRRRWAAHFAERRRERAAKRSPP